MYRRYCLSASSAIESTIGGRFPLPEKGEDDLNYGKVMAIYMGCLFGYVLLLTFVGPELRIVRSQQDKVHIIDENESRKSYSIDKIEITK